MILLTKLKFNSGTSKYIKWLKNLTHKGYELATIFDTLRQVNLLLRYLDKPLVELVVQINN